MEDCFEKTRQLLFRGGTSFWNNGLYSARGRKFHAGTGIAVSRTFTPCITSKGVPVEGRAQFITMELNRQTLGILNIYAPNDTGQRARF